MINSIELKDFAERALMRSKIYNLLAIVYHEEPTEMIIKQIKGPQLLNALSGLGVRFEDDFADLPGKMLLENLAVEFSRLFIGPGKHISPHESVHIEGESKGPLWGDATVKVKKFIESSGLNYKSEYRGLPDHISVELEFLQIVTRQAEQTWGNKNYNGTFNCFKIEKKFIEEHLEKWVPLFCDQIIKETKLSFYREMACFTKKFITFAKEEASLQA